MRTLDIFIETLLKPGMFIVLNIKIMIMVNLKNYLMHYMKEML